MSVEESHTKASTEGASDSESVSGHFVRLGIDAPLRLDCGVEISDFPVVYQTYGALNQDNTNAILICHALTGDQFVAGEHPISGKRGWWDLMVGPGKTIDTDKYFVICANILGGCLGTLGPKETNPETGKPWGLGFPVITIADMVRCQALLLDHLGIEKLFAVAGGSMGGMQVLGMGDDVPGTGVRRHPHCYGASAHGAKHRLSRSRTPGDHG